MGRAGILTNTDISVFIDETYYTMDNSVPFPLNVILLCVFIVFMLYWASQYQWFGRLLDFFGRKQ